MENLNNDLFNLDSEGFIDPKPENGKDLQEFKPYATKQPDKVYKAIIRFIPNWKDPNNKSKIKKHYIWVDDPISGDKFTIDCPSTIGEKSLLQDTYWKLYNSDSAKNKELSKKFSRKTSYYSIIQIVDDKQNPDNNGKIMYWKYGVKVNEKIEKALKPEIGVPMNPFNLLKSKLFLVNVNVKFDWNNYDNCEFVGEFCPFELEGKAISATNEDMEKVSNYLKDNSPDINRFEYKSWTDDDKLKVVNYIKNTIPDITIVEQLIGKQENKSLPSDLSARTYTDNPPVLNNTEENNTQEDDSDNEDSGPSSLKDLYENL